MRRSCWRSILRVLLPASLLLLACLPGCGYALVGTTSALPENIKVIAVLRSSEPLFRQPTDLRRDGATVKLDSIPGRDVVYVRWLVEGAGAIPRGRPGQAQDLPLHL